MSGSPGLDSHDSLVQLLTKIQASGTLNDLDSLVIAKAVATGFALDPVPAIDLLDILVSRSPKALSRQVQGQTLAMQLVDQIIKVSDDTFASRGLTSVISVFHKVRPLATQIQTLIDILLNDLTVTIESQSHSRSNVLLKALFLLKSDMRPRTVLKLCRVARSVNISPDTASQGLVLGQTWLSVTLDWICSVDYGSIDDTEQALFLLKVTRLLITGELSRPHQRLSSKSTEIEFCDRTASFVAFTYLESALASSNLHPVLPSIDWQSMTLPGAVQDELADFSVLTGIPEPSPIAVAPWFPLQSLIDAGKFDTNDLVHAVTSDFPTMVPNDKLKTLQLLTNVLKNMLFHHQKSPRYHVHASPDREPMEENWLTMFTTIVESNDLLTSQELRLEACNLLSFALLMWQPQFQLNHSTVVGSWLIGCLKSSSRSLRVLSTHLIGAFANTESSKESVSSLFRLTNTLQNSTCFEMSILAWSEAAIVAEGEHLNLLLLRLIDVLGSENFFHRSLAFQELRRVASSTDQTPWQLCAPFWPTISVAIVRQLKEQRRLVENFCLLLGISEADFLIRTRDSTVPYLVLSRRLEAVKTIAEAMATSVKKLIFDLIPNILATLLTQDVDDPMEFAQKRLMDVDRGFANVEFSHLMSTHSPELYFEILVLAPARNTADDRESRIVRALSLIPTEKNSVSETLSDTFVYRLIIQFSNSMRNLNGRLHYTNKLQCLRGLELLLRTCEADFSGVSSQLLTLLQSSLELPVLSDGVIMTWHSLVVSIGDKVPSVIDLTFAVITQLWNSFSPIARDTCQNIVQSVIDNVHGRQFIETFGTLSLPPSLHVLVEPILGTRKPFVKFRDIVRRSNQENIYIARQTVQELISFVSDNQPLLQVVIDDEKCHEQVEQAIRALLDIASKFRETAPDLSLLCSKCLGLIGAIDPHRIDIQPKDTRPVVIESFVDGRESMKFVAYFIENFLLKELESSINPGTQMLIAFGIQEYLKFCNFTATSPISDWTDLFSSNVYHPLLPFVNTKHSIKMPLAISTQQYPIYNSTITFSTWLSLFSNDMMCRTNGHNAETIFSLCRKIQLKEQNSSILMFMLPYATLNAILGSEENREVFLIEVKTVLEANTTSDDDVSAFHKCIFSLLDYFAKWARAKRQLRKASDVKVVESLVSQISLNLMAERAFECKSFPRAIRYWEQSLREGEIEHEDVTYERFRVMYASLGEIDDFEGMSTKFSSMTTRQQILENETTGNWDSALACYDVLAAELGLWDIKTTTSMLGCLKHADRNGDVLSRLNTLSSSKTSSVTPEIAGIGIEAAWRLHDWNEVKRWVSQTPQDGEILPAYTGRVLLAIKTHDYEEVVASFNAARSASAKILSGREITSLSEISSTAVYLHALADLESISSLVFSAEEPSNPKQIMRDLDSRLDRLGVDYEAKDYLLSLRRAAFEGSTLSFAKEEVGRVFYLTAREARKKNHWTEALASVLNAKHHKYPLAGKEHAKLLWARGETRQAMQILRNELKDDFLKDFKRIERPSRRFTTEYAKTALLYTDWLESSGQAHSSELIGRYQAIQNMRPKWDKAHYRLVKHILKIYDTQLSLSPKHRSSSYYEGYLVSQIISLLAQTLSEGIKYMTQALPKLITLWLDFGTSVAEKRVLKDFEDASKGESFLALQAKVLDSINQTLQRFSSKIPAYVFYQALPQILSRINHPDAQVYEVMKRIVVEVSQLYPEQALWSIVELASTSTKNDNMSSELRRIRGLDILSTLESKGGRQRAQIKDARVFIESLKMVCYYTRDHMEPILRLDKIGFNMKLLPCPLAVPVQKMMVGVMPDPGMSMSKHSAFPDVVTIFKLNREAHVQHSQQKPKRLTVVGSDGLLYNLLCKGGDDVRKDARLIEFTTTINGLLQKNDEAMTRHLKIETYRVTPIDETSGVIEWVDGAKPMKSVIESNFLSRGINFALSKVQFDPKLDSATRHKNYKRVLNDLPPVLYDWFIYTFPDPVAWLAARRRYAQSTAVMSMVGYILGLGDRHLENLLLLQNSGKILHVDFDCLFDKGARFTVPEVVPFRLTPNMVDAFGLQGYEGPYRKACEITLGLLRDNEDLLMTVLEPFVHDPVVLSSGSKKIKREPQYALETIRSKIRGSKSRDSLPLSVAGQVEDLIQQAVSIENLSRMYIGWASFL